MHHVELLPDAATDAAVRAEWRALADAALPSQERHASASNRPHVTLTMSEAWPEGEALAGVTRPLTALPLPARLGSTVVFGRGPFVLARLVVASRELLALHADLAARLGPLASDLLVPGRWTPHVTLGRRLSAAQVAAALEVLGAGGERDIVLERARHWDSRARLDEPLASATAPPLVGADGT